MNTRLCRCLFPLVALTLAGCGGSAADSGASSSDKVSAAVATQAVHQGSLPDVVSAYGTAAPAIDAASTLSIQAECAVTQFDVTAGTAVHCGQRLLTFTLSPTAAAAYQQARTALNVAQAAREHTAQLMAHQLATRDQLAQANKAASDARSALDALRKQQGDGRTTELRAPFDGIVSSIAATIAAAVEEQGSSTAEIARSMTEAAQVTRAVVGRIGDVSAEAEEARRQAARVNDNAQALALDVKGLQQTIVRTVRIAAPEVDRRAEPRLPVRLMARVVFAGGHELEVPVADISSGGAAFEEAPAVPVGAHGTLILAGAPKLEFVVLAAEAGRLHVAFTGDAATAQSVVAQLTAARGRAA